MSFAALAVTRAAWSVPKTWYRAGWALAPSANGFLLERVTGTESFEGEGLRRLSVRNGWFSASLVVAGEPERRYRGLPKQQGPSLARSLHEALLRFRVREPVDRVVTWYAAVREAADSAAGLGRWMDHDTRRRLKRARPSRDVTRPLREHADELAGALDPYELEAVRFLGTDLDRWIDDRNEEILEAETARHADFFARIETKPLTEEQIRAVVCFDNRVQVIASAGSGKTSVMVARAAYAVLRGFVPPDRILLMAFNAAAAAELQERVKARFLAVGLASEGIRVATFHAFGLKIIGQATKRKPRAAPWLDDGGDVRMICRLVDELRDSSPSFAYEWDLFRLVYGRVGDAVDGGVPDGYDSGKRRTGFTTARGDVVKSHGERLIADFLYYNGVSYEYERAYEHDTATESRSQYRPDFFYPSVPAYHEHWGLDADGNPPPQPDPGEYLRNMKWKRELHAKHRTTLIETTFAEVMASSGLERLATTLGKLGVKLDWNPDRPAAGLPPMEHEQLARLVRSFMAHVKSNSLTPADLDARVAERLPAVAQPRARLFLEIYRQIADRWDARLASEGYVDFEDMLVQAASHVEQKRADGRADLVLVDEFQDASWARARLTRALTRGRGKYLLAVGDDWQSINRFAGADVAVMRDFTSYFGAGPTLRLQTTFRCPQSLCDTAGDFVAKNPRQLEKVVVSAHRSRGPKVRLVRVASDEDRPRALAAELDRIAAAAPARRAPWTVQVLGRYRFDRQAMPPAAPAGLDVSFRTIHSSKGLEADYVVLPNVTTGAYGFPSTIEDDPVLGVAMAEADQYPFAEERRLLYVALTRARKAVTLITVAGRESPFVVELIQDGLLDVETAEGAHEPHPCPTCQKGVLVPRTGPYGDFFGCSTFPRCRHTARTLPTPAVADAPHH